MPKRSSKRLRPQVCSTPADAGHEWPPLPQRSSQIVQEPPSAPPPERNVGLPVQFRAPVQQWSSQPVPGPSHIEQQQSQEIVPFHAPPPPPQPIVRAPLPRMKFERVNGAWTAIPVETDCHRCRVSTATVTTFYNHLATAEHSFRSFTVTPEAVQFGNLVIKVPEFLLWDDEVNQRSVVVTDCGQTPDSLAFLKHFGRFGFVQDFIAQRSGDFVIIQFYNECCITRILEEKHSNFLNDDYLRLRRKSSVSTMEWTVMLDLDGIYEKQDQPFFIEHFELMKKLENQPIHFQFENLMKKITLGPCGMQAMHEVFQILFQQLQMIFPHMICRLTHPQVAGMLESDHVFGLFVDPYGQSMFAPKEMPSISYQSSVACQIAMQRIRLLLKYMQGGPNPGLENMALRVMLVPDYMFFNDLFHDINSLVFIHNESGMKGAINFYDPFQPFVASLLDLMAEVDPIVIPLVRFIHYWARLCRLTEPKMPTVLTSCLLVFLMRKNILPSVHALRQLHDFSQMVYGRQNPSQQYLQGWQVNICNHVPAIRDYLCGRRNDPRVSDMTRPAIVNQPKIRVIFLLLKEFFAAYGNTMLSSHVVSPFMGCLITKEEFIAGRRGPTEFRNVCPEPSYWNSATHHGSPISSANWCIAVQHPFDLNRNVAFNFTQQNVDCFQLACRRAAERFAAALDNPNPHLEDVLPGFASLLKFETAMPGPEGWQGQMADTDSDTDVDYGLSINLDFLDMDD